MIRTSEQVTQHHVASNWEAAVDALRTALSGAIKRAFDFLAALIGLFLLLPVFALIGVLIKRDSPGPVFYWGPRVGRNGRVFRMLKFRTMYEDPRSYQGPRVTAQDDERITAVGRWLRNTKLNELPQLWNVLNGEMSLVGPRPEDPAIAKTWPTHIAREILRMRPGITSPASVLYRDEEKMLPAMEVMQKYLHHLSPDKMRLDQLYTRYHSFWLDLDVILWTFLLLMPKIRSYAPPEQHLFVGPVSKLIQRYVIWFLCDFTVVFCAIGLTGLAFRLFGPLNIGLTRAIGMALGFSALLTLAGTLLDTNRINWRKATLWASGRVWLSWFAATAVVVTLHYYLEVEGLRIFGVLVPGALVSIAGILVIRYRERLVSGVISRIATRGLSRRSARERVLVVGSGRTAEHIAWLMEHPTYLGKFQIVGFIDDDLRSQGMKIYGARVIGRTGDIERIAKEQDVGLIILADNQTAALNFRRFWDITNFSPARVVVAPDVFGSLSGLEATSQGVRTPLNLREFQCQHCLIRYSDHRESSPHAVLKKPG